MVLAVAEAQFEARPGFSGNAAEGLDRSAVVVDGGALHIKFLDRGNGQAGEQGGSIRRVELIQGPSKPIIGETHRRSLAVAQGPQIQRGNKLLEEVAQVEAAQQMVDQRQGAHVEPSELPDGVA